MASYEDTVDEPLNIVYGAFGDWGETLTDTAEMDQSFGWYLYATRQIDELVQWRESFVKQITWHTTLVQRIGLSVPFLKYYIGASLTQAMTVTQTDAYYAYAVRELDEEVRIAQTAGFGLKYVATLAQALALRDRMKSYDGTTLVETFTLADVARMFQYVEIVEGLGLTDQVLMPWKVYSTVAEQMQMADALARYLGARVDDVVAVIETLARKRRLQPELSQSVTVVDTLSRGFLLRVDASESIEITPSDALKMIFRPTLADAVEIVSFYLDPEGVTTWAVNLSHGGVSEYTNYNFNSFAQLGNKYIAASEDGLYELDGDDDDGEDIIARVKSGMLQFGKSNYASFKGIYLGVRGDGQYVLKLVTGDDKSYTYQVTARSMTTTKVNVGKGLRARYFSYELISTGQDFDLDSIEFLPLVARRRV